MHLSFSTDIIFLSFFSVFFFCLIFFNSLFVLKKNYRPHCRKKILTRALRRKEAILFLWPNTQFHFSLMIEQFLPNEVKCDIL